MPALELRLLGPFRVAVDDRPVHERAWKRRKPQQLVKLLAIQPHYTLHKEQVIDLLWPDLDADSAANQLYKTVHLARHALEPNLAPRESSRFILSRNDVIALDDTAGLWIDTEEFERLALDAIHDRHLSTGEAALSLYVDDLLPGDIYEDWAAPLRQHLRSLHENLLASMAEACAETGRLDRSIELHGELLRRDPSNEDAHRSLMRLYAATGRRHQALRQYEACRDALRVELDADPEPETEALRRTFASASPRSAAVLPPTRVEQPAPHGGSEHDPQPTPDPGRLSPTRQRLFFRCAVAAAIVIALLLTPGTPWSAKLRYKASRAVSKWLAGPSAQLVSITGELDVPNLRVEALDSVSGWATFADADGRFLLLDVAWQPGATCRLLVSDARSARLLTLTMPEDRPVDGLLDVGSIAAAAERPIDTTQLFGVNSIGYVEFDLRNSDYYRGVFEAICIEKNSSDEKIEGVNRLLASRYLPQALVATSPRTTLEHGSGMSGDLALAMATIVYAGGYDVRLVDMTDDTVGRRAHKAVEVYFDSAWHLYDPSYGLCARNRLGAVASYEELHRDPDMVANVPFCQVPRPGWSCERMPAIYRSGIHHYSYFRGTARSDLARLLAGAPRHDPIVLG